MGSFSIWHWLIVLLVVLLLFGGSRKLSRLLGDFGSGLKAFKRNVQDDGASADADTPKALDDDGSPASDGKKSS